MTHNNFFPSNWSELSKGRHFRRNIGKTNVFIGCRAIFPPNIRKSLKIVPLNTIFLKIDINRYLWVLVGKLLTRTFRKSQSFDEFKAIVWANFQFSTKIVQFLLLFKLAWQKNGEKWTSKFRQNQTRQFRLFEFCLKIDTFANLQLLLTQNQGFAVHGNKK